MAKAKEGEPSRKPVVWLHGEVKTPPFTPEGRQEAGMLLRLLQEGERLGKPNRCQTSGLDAERCGFATPSIIGESCTVSTPTRFLSWRCTRRRLSRYPTKSSCDARNDSSNTTRSFGRRRRNSQVSEDRTMDATKRKALEAARWKIGDAADFLEMSDEERQLLDARVSLALAIRQQRETLELSQKELGAKLKTSQPRVAKIERAASDVSLDQLVRAFTAAGGRIVIKSAKSKRSKGKPANGMKAATVVMEVTTSK